MVNMMLEVVYTTEMKGSILLVNGMNAGFIRVASICFNMMLVVSESLKVFSFCKVCFPAVSYCEKYVVQSLYCMFYCYFWIGRSVQNYYGFLIIQLQYETVFKGEGGCIPSGFITGKVHMRE